MLNPNGLWLGEWSSKPAGSGKAVCMIAEKDRIEIPSDQIQ